MAKMGRPKHELDWALFEKLCGIGCTKEEIAHMLGVSDDSIERHVKARYKATFAVTFKRFFSVGKQSLRRRMYTLAMDGNVTMCIFLSKQWLGFADKVEHSYDELPSRPGVDL